MPRKQHRLKNGISYNLLFTYLRKHNFRIPANFGILLSTAGILCWLFTISTTSVQWVDPRYEFGLFQIISITFWVGLSLHLAGILLRLKRSREIEFLLSMIIFGLMIWCTAVFIEPNARIQDSWWHFGTTKTILDSGRINLEGSYATHHYLQWPGFFVFSALSVIITSADQLLYLKFFPLISTIIFLVGFYAWMRNITESREVLRFSVILFILLDLWLQFHHSPQAFGLMLLPPILLCLGKKEMSWKISGVVLLLVLVISHPTTTVFLIVIVVSQRFILLLFGFWKNNRKKAHIIREKFITTKIAVFAFWVILLVMILIYINFLLDFRSVLDPKELATITQYFLISKTNFLPSLIRLVLIFLVSIVACTYIFHLRNIPTTFSTYFGWVIGCVISFLYAFILFDGQLHERALMFGFFILPLPLAFYLFKKPSLREIKRIAISLIIIFSLLGTATLYYHENDSIVSDSNIAISAYLADHQPPQKIYGDHINPIYFFNPEMGIRSFYSYTSTGHEITNNSIIIIDSYTLSLDKPIGVNMRKQYASTINKNNYSCIYTNGMFKAYLCSEEGIEG